ncbi:MAG: hypothetical protein LIO46_00265 [Clostridiales bacterium]|nr:hypothetical protein [Clostridiales bacterium]
MQNAKAADSWDGSVAAAFAGGDGSEASPYLIETPAQLAFLAQQVNDGITTYEGAFLRLEADLDLAHQTWAPIGYSNQRLTWNHTDSNASPRGAGTYRPFMGSFDGGGYTVSNLAVTGSGSTYAADYKGLFGIVDGGFAGSGTAAEIKSLTIADAAVTGSSGIAALIGYTVGDVTVRDCRVENAQVSSITASGAHSAGGLIGQLDLEKENTMAVQDCTVTDSAVASIAAFGRTGGLIGSVRPPLKECYHPRLLCHRRCLRGENPLRRPSGLCGRESGKRADHGGGLLLHRECHR